MSRNAYFQSPNKLYGDKIINELSEMIDDKFKDSNNKSQDTSYNKDLSLDNIDDDQLFGPLEPR